ncbi:hypothetical protein [Methylomonas rivi]|uniref:Uncharacterized protein n=1 Tax=Methylomonas rivi TaxID=2952226 RepID=A0ABT1U8T9_9GAMM|nr:hypothetical protein [Methylomonas sp. WSC-6]MCQ8129933.1 hypothetical protein [Methylomonas sp. WSC-6]
MNLHDSNKLELQRDACGLWCHTALAQLLTRFAATITCIYDRHNLTVNTQNHTVNSDAYTALADKLTILEYFNGYTINAVLLGAASCDNTWNMAI